MNATAQFILICERAFLAAGSNNLNLINIFSAINATAFPATWPQFSLVVNFDIDTAGPHKIVTTVFNPAGTQVARTEVPVTVTPGNMQVIAHFEQMQFAVPGTYRFEVRIDDTPLGMRALQVNAVVSPNTQKTNFA